MRIFLLAALALAIIGLICVAVPTTVAGTDWPTWLMGALVSYFLDKLLDTRINI